MIEPIHLIFGFITAAIIVAFSALFFVLRSRYRQSGERRWFRWSVVALAVVIAGIGIEVYLATDFYYVINHRTLEYSLVLDSSSVGFDQVYVPISQNPYLQDSLRVKSGTGTFSIVDTEKGQALLVNFSGRIEIAGKVDTLLLIGEYDLTMVNSTDSHWERVEVWMQYTPHNPSDFNCSFDLRMEYDSFSSHVSYDSEGYLTEGRETYWADHFEVGW